MWEEKQGSDSHPSEKNTTSVVCQGGLLHEAGRGGGCEFWPSGPGTFAHSQRGSFAPARLWAVTGTETKYKQRSRLGFFGFLQMFALGKYS